MDEQLVMDRTVVDRLFQVLNEISLDAVLANEMMPNYYAKYLCITNFIERIPKRHNAEGIILSDVVDLIKERLTFDDFTKMCFAPQGRFFIFFATAEFYEDFLRKYRVFIDFSTCREIYHIVKPIYGYHEINLKYQFYTTDKHYLYRLVKEVSLAEFCDYIKLIMFSNPYSLSYFPDFSSLSISSKFSEYVFDIILTHHDITSLAKMYFKETTSYLHRKKNTARMYKVIKMATPTQLVSLHLATPYELTPSLHAAIFEVPRKLAEINSFCCYCHSGGQIETVKLMPCGHPVCDKCFKGEKAIICWCGRELMTIYPSDKRGSIIEIDESKITSQGNSKLSCDNSISKTIEDINVSCQDTRMLNQLYERV